MPRFRPIRSPEAVSRRIREETHDTRTTSKIPVWNNDWDVDCYEMVLPLEYLFYRINNARTIDSQLALLNSDRQMLHPLTQEILPRPSEHCFSPDSQFEQETQDLQGALLCIEANRRRENGNNLFEELKAEGWLRIEVPIITRQGVLINGNSRVAALEAMLRNGDTIRNIDSNNPQIRVRVVPNDGSGEPDIEKLENHLQKRDGIRLNYNWIQDCTKIRRRLQTESMATIHEDYSDLNRFRSIPQMEKTLRARGLVDELFAMIDKPHQAIFEEPNEHMIYAMQDQIDNDYNNSTPERLTKAKSLFAHMLHITQDGSPIGEMRYHVNRIKSEDDVTRFCEEIEEVIPELFTSTTSQDQLGRPQQIFTYNISSFTDASENQQSEVAREIDRIAEELRVRNSGEDAETAVLKRIREATRKIEISREGYEGLDNYANQVILRTKLTELARKIRDYLENIQ